MPHAALSTASSLVSRSAPWHCLHAHEPARLTCSARLLQFIRHPSNPAYTPEPDLCHELLGHVPMLTDPAFSEMVFNIGLASLAADESQIWHLSKLFW